MSDTRQKTLREELEQVIVTIQLRRANAREMVQQLIHQKTAPGDEPAQEPVKQPVARFQNSNAKSFMFSVTKPFQVATVAYREKDSVVVRRTADGKFELENRETGGRAIMDLEVWEKVRKAHLDGQWPEGEWGF